MNSTVKVMLFYFLFIWLLVEVPYFLENPPAWNPIDYARISNLDYKATILDEPGHGGNVLIKERITFDIHAASKSNPFWELWRYLPEDTADGLKIGYNILSVKQILDDGTEIIYEESPKLYWDDSDYTNTRYGYGPYKWYHSKGPYNEYLDNYECLFFYVDGIYRDKITFEIEYEMTNAALRYADCSELYLPMCWEDSIAFLESFNAEILFKDEDMPETENYEAYTYGTNSNEFKFTKSDTKNPGYHTFSIELDESDLNFKPYNAYLDFSLVSHGDDKHIFTEHAPDNIYSDDVYLEEFREEQKNYENAPTRYMLFKVLIFLLSIIGVFLILRFAKFIARIARNKHVFYNPEMQMDFFREIPSDLDPNFAAYLVFSKHKSSKKLKNRKDGFSGLLLSLIRKKYITVEKVDNFKDWTPRNTKIILNNVINSSSINSQNIFGTNNPIISYFENNVLNESQSEFTNTDNQQFSPDFLNENSAYDNVEPLTLAEKYYYDLLVRHAVSNEITMSKLQNRISYDYEYTSNFVDNIENSVGKIGTTYEYFQKINFNHVKDTLRFWSIFFVIVAIIFIVFVNISAYSTPIDLAFGAFFILGIGFLLGADYLDKASKNSILFTQFGENEYAKWRGLYNYLNSETLMNEKTLIELPLWEKYLIYATAFGISDKVVKVLKIKCPDFETTSSLNTSYCTSRRIRKSYRSFNSSLHRASRTHRSNSGYSGGRGFGGGGGGH